MDSIYCNTILSDVVIDLSHHLSHHNLFSLILFGKAAGACLIERPLALHYCCTYCSACSSRAFVAYVWLLRVSQSKSEEVCVRYSFMVRLCHTMAIKFALVVFKDDNKRYVIPVKDIIDLPVPKGVEDFNKDTIYHAQVLRRQGSETTEQHYQATILLLAGINGFESSYAPHKFWICTHNTKIRLCLLTVIVSKQPYP